MTIKLKTIIKKNINEKILIILIKINLLKINSIVCYFMRSSADSEIVMVIGVVDVGCMALWCESYHFTIAFYFKLFVVFIDSVCACVCSFSCVCE